MGSDINTQSQNYWRSCDWLLSAVLDYVDGDFGWISANPKCTLDVRFLEVEDFGQWLIPGAWFF